MSGGTKPRMFQDCACCDGKSVYRKIFYLNIINFHDTRMDGRHFKQANSGYVMHENTLCSEKKHPLTFSFISLLIICGFKQKLQ